MKKGWRVKISACMFCCILLLTACKSQNIRHEAISNPSEGYTVTDIQGTVIQMPGRPQHIVALSASLDETLLGLVEIQRMAAVDEGMDDPAASNVTELVKQVPARVKRAPSAETIAALQPDLVIAPDWGNLEVVSALRDLGIPVVVCKGPQTLQDIKDNIRLLSVAVGEPQRGEVLQQKMQAKLDEIEQKVARIPVEQRKSAVWLSTMRSYGGSGSSFDEACQFAGVRNGMAEAGVKNGQTMSKEMLLAVNPDFLFLPGDTKKSKGKAAELRDEYLQDPSLQVITAIRKGNLREPRSGYLLNCSQDFVFGVQEIAYMVYGDAFAQAADCHLTAVDEE